MAKRKYERDSGILRPNDFPPDLIVLDPSECDAALVRERRIRAAEKRLALMPRLLSGRSVLADGRIARLWVSERDGDFVALLPNGAGVFRLDSETMRPVRTKRVIH